MNTVNIVCFLWLFCAFGEKWLHVAGQEKIQTDQSTKDQNGPVHFENPLLHGSTIVYPLISKKRILINDASNVSVNADDNPISSFLVETPVPENGGHFKIGGDNTIGFHENINRDDHLENQLVTSSSTVSKLHENNNNGLIKSTVDFKHLQPPPLIPINNNAEVTNLEHQTEIFTLENVIKPDQHVTTMPPLSLGNIGSINRVILSQQPGPEKNVVENIDHQNKIYQDRNFSVQTYQTVPNRNIFGVKEATQKYLDNNCSDNEVYIIDGERTLLLTNKKLTTDIEIIQDETINLQSLVKNQDTVIFLLKQRLVNSEAQVEDSLGLLVEHEKSYQKLLREMKDTKANANDNKLRREVLEEALVKERQERKHYHEISSDLQQQIEALNERLNAMMDETNEQCDKTIRKFQNKYTECKQKTDKQDLNINRLHHEQKLIQDNLATFNRTRFYYNKPKCKLMQKQLASQDNTIILLKDQIKSQAHTLESMNRLISMKHDTMANLHNQLSSHLERQKKAEADYGARDELLLSQQETISLLKQLRTEEDYLRRARDIALGILQGTVYRMVNNIDKCSDEVVEGLKARIESLEKSQEPLQDMMSTLRKSIAESGKVTKMEQAHNANIKKLLNMRTKTIELMTKEKQALDDTAAFCTGKCKFDPALLSKMDYLYRTVNTISCEPICKENNNKYVAGRVQDQRKRQHKKHKGSHKKLPSFLAPRKDQKIFGF